MTTRDESFLDLSLEISQNASVDACIRNFSASEALRRENKFFCDTCGSLQARAGPARPPARPPTLPPLPLPPPPAQEARKRIRFKRLPNVLALHLKRFKYVEQLQVP